jgi:hypothetical protein
MSDTPTPVPVSVSTITALPTEIATWLSGLVEATHKQFAILWGILATTGVVGVPAGAKLGGGALLVYGALAHLAENLFKK